MRIVICTLALAMALSLGGCAAAVSELLKLSANDIASLSENVEETLDIQKKLSEFTFLAATGGLNDLGQYDYTPPDASNGWVGLISAPSGLFPFGTGELMIQFTTTGDGGPVDPYTTDLTDDLQVSIDAVVDFVGTSLLGYPVQANGDFTMDTTQNGPQDVVALLNGNYNINHGDYTSLFDANQLEVGLDLLREEITSMQGNLTGSIDIPNFAFDADFVIQGLGDRIDIAIDAAATEIHYVMDLVDL